MCGIAGFYLRQKQAAVADVKTMCDQIRHRGPDDEGFYTDGGCGIGMRRLSIIDLSTGHQPISNEDGSIWVVFNGEVYNYQEIRRDLMSRGHTFRTNSDTETLVHLYEEYGVEGLPKLRGMYAFCIWDGKRKQLLLVRDRFGKKPLYYSALPEGLHFGSELKCLRAAGVPLEVDREALQLYFQFNYIPEPWSAYRNILKLPPASWLIYSADGTIRTGKYWELPEPMAEPVTSAAFDEASTCDRLRQIFDDSVKMRMIADVPLGAFLSGGTDSSLVVASMALQSPDRVKTFSIGFEEAEFNELPYAAAVAAKYNTDHHEVILKPDAVDLVERVAWHLDEPLGDTAAIPTYLVSKAAVEHVKVALSGDGGDELFGGYGSFAAVERLKRFDALPQPLRRAISFFSEMLPYSARGKNYLRMASRPSALDRYFEYNYSPYFMRKRLLQDSWMLPADPAYLHKAMSHFLLPDSTDIVSQVMYFETAANLVSGMLVKVDRMSMAASLEVRCPFLDHVLAEFAAQIPNGWKIREGRGKYIVLKALGDRLPPELLTRKKMGFSFPLPVWFRTSLKPLLWDYLTSTRFLSRGIVSPEFVSTMLDEHDSGRRDNSNWLWSLLILELWFRNLEQPVHAGAGAAQ